MSRSPRAVGNSWHFCFVERSTPTVDVGDGLHTWAFYFTNSEVGIPSGGAGFTHSIPIDPITEYHRYTIQFSQNGPGPADDTADFLVDDVLVFDDIGRSDLDAHPLRLVFFGGIGSFSTSDAHYSLITFDDGNLCGNGVLDAGEACDDGAQNGEIGSCCTPSCTCDNGSDGCGLVCSGGLLTCSDAGGTCQCVAAP